MGWLRRMSTGGFFILLCLMFGIFALPDDSRWMGYAGAMALVTFLDRFETRIRREAKLDAQAEIAAALKKAEPEPTYRLPL